MNLIHLTSSRFFGGPERQMLGLALAMRGECRSLIASFSEGGRCGEFLQRAHSAGIEAVQLHRDTPRLMAATREVDQLIRSTQAQALLCHGYKAGLVGLFAARRAGIAAVAVSRGWTAESRRVRLYEALDRRAIRWMDGVVCVSRAQADKVARAGVAPRRIIVIPNAIDLARFAPGQPSGRAALQQLFERPRRWICGAAGRLSSEKGFDVLVAAAEQVLRWEPDAGFVIFGEGQERARLEAQIAQRGLSGRFVLGGFRDDLDCLLPHVDLFVQSSYSEGMPNVILEALAAGLPIVATAVGGTAEVLDHGQFGQLIRPGDASELEQAIVAALRSETDQDDERRRRRDWLAARFSFEAQADAYRQWLGALLVGTSVLANAPAPIA